MASFSSTNESFIPTLSQGILILASLVSATVVLLAKGFFSKRLVDQHGNSIPNGPMGVPILG